MYILEFGIIHSCLYPDYASELFSSSYKLFGKGKLSKEGIATRCNVSSLNMTTLVNWK